MAIHHILNKRRGGVERNQLHRRTLEGGFKKPPIKRTHPRVENIRLSQIKPIALGAGENRTNPPENEGN